MKSSTTIRITDEFLPNVMNDAINDVITTDPIFIITIITELRTRSIPRLQQTKTVLTADNVTVYELSIHDAITILSETLQEIPRWNRIDITMAKKCYKHAKCTIKLLCSKGRLKQYE